ncbi:hypothetical protein ARMSODRAFT_213998 [Armillaria solidipes]|uniref:Uncharacterized protein n=1 Tax=Armillaria solidipes TaxID=1076256 RepID=A0A2H3BBQ9_9AGAR|nr:hypothetical protein ARMSODRAFT_213998 [Armillaria solidipes]
MRNPPQGYLERCASWHECIELKSLYKSTDVKQHRMLTYFCRDSFATTIPPPSSTFARFPKNGGLLFISLALLCIFISPLPSFLYYSGCSIASYQALYICVQ